MSGRPACPVWWDNEKAMHPEPTQDHARQALRASLLAFIATAPLREVQLLDALRARIEAGREALAQAVGANGDRGLGAVRRAAMLDLMVLDEMADEEDG